MSSKIFRSSFFTSMIVLVATLALITGVLFEYFGVQLQNELKSEASYISHALQNEGISYIETFESSDKRITLIADDGKVLADTSADEKELENHVDREEVKEALATGSGTSERYSKTLMEKTIYYAEKQDDGTILRVSATQQSVIPVLLGLVYPVIIIFAVALILSFVLSSRVSKAIIEPLNYLDLNSPENNETYEEIAMKLEK